MLIRCICLFGSLFISDVLAGQSDRSLKLYQNLDYYHHNLIRWSANYARQSTISSGYVSNFGRQTFAFTWSRKPKYEQEIQVSYGNSPANPHTSATRYSNDEDITRLFLSIGYQISRNFKKPNNPLSYSLGISPVLYHYAIWDTPPYDYSTTETNIGGFILILPGLNLPIISRLSLDIDVPFSLVNIYLYKFYWNNPQISKSPYLVDREVQWNLFQGFFNLRLGLSYSF